MQSSEMIYMCKISFCLFIFLVENQHGAGMRQLMPK